MASVVKGSKNGLMKFVESVGKAEAESAKEAAKPDAKAVHSKSQSTILGLLAELGGGRTGDDDLSFEGRKFIVPETMTTDAAIDFLKKHKAQQEEETVFTRVFKYRPWDGAHAMQAALKRVFGTAGIAKPTQTMFGPVPPRMIDINVGPNETMQVPWGEIEVPMFDGTIELSGTRDKEHGVLFFINVTAARKYASHIQGLFRVVEEELAARSIYKGAAIDGKQNADFLDLAGFDPAKIVFSDHATTELEAHVWSLIRHSDKMKELGLPLKRAVLLEGPYGTGKTSAAYMTAQIAVEHGWSFIFCRPGKDNMEEVMATARLYQPSVVFFEDIDGAASSGDDDEVTRLLELFDGMSSKGTELVAVMTTNHVERIHKGMVRPGRLDAVIHIGSLDTRGIQRMIESIVSPKLLEDSVDYELIGEAMKGFLPAFVKESIDRAIRYNIARNPKSPGKLGTIDFVSAADGLRPQLQLMEDAGHGKTVPTMDAAVSELVRNTMHGIQVMDEPTPDDPDACVRGSLNGKVKSHA